MYSIIRDGNQYLYDKTFAGTERLRIDANGDVTISRGPPALWQEFDGIGIPYIEEDFDKVVDRKDKLQRIYEQYDLQVTKLTDSELEAITFRKLKSY